MSLIMCGFVLHELNTDTIHNSDLKNIVTAFLKLFLTRSVS